ncbi:MAG TPA: hypothetical protein VJV78_15100 [Polyangiales bacterium]|nr:hypothetical protein [Polyangiales bacterium]
MRAATMRLGGPVLLCALACQSIAGAQNAQAPNDPRVLSITVSGGVSLGAFEAGVLYFLSEAIKRSEGAVDLRIATGASAGSANALISLLDSCSARVDDPTQSLGFQTWIPVGLQQLFKPDEVTPTSVLSREPLREAMQRVATKWRAGLRADCDVVLGVSVTRKVPESSVLGGNNRGPAVQVPRSGEKFVVRIQGRGAGRVPLLSNYVDPHAPLPQPFLPLSAAEDDAAQAHNFEQLLDLLYASAAFPFAFAPHAILHCETDPRADMTAQSLICEHPERSLFIDGGVFDNSPLRLNYRVVQRGLRRGADGRVVWLPPGTEDRAKPPAVRYSYIDPATGDFPALDVEEKAAEEGDALDLGAHLAQSFVESARRRELLALLEDTDAANALGDIGMTQNQLPTISSQLGAFFGFFERDFRELDFYIGMYDGMVSVQRFLETSAPSQAVKDLLSAAFPVLQQPLRNDLPRGLLPFACLVSQVERGYAGLAPACDGPELRNFRILLQVTLDRLHAACKRTPADKIPPQASGLCFDAARGKPRVLVRGVPPLPVESCSRTDEELDFAYSLRLFSEYQFAFRDLGLAREDAHYGLVKIRRRLLEIATSLADAQPNPVSQALIVTAGRIGVNQILYEPPRNLVYLTAGTAVEIGATLMPFKWNESWVRANLALQIGHWETIVTPDHLALNFSPMIGPEFQLLFMSSQALQWMIGGRVGYQFSVTDGAGFSDCTEESSFGDGRNCSQLLVQGYLASGLLERLRAQLVLEVYPTGHAPEYKSRIGLQLSFGLQLF